MPKSKRLDQTFHIIIEHMITTGQAPNYLEIAKGLGVSAPVWMASLMHILQGNFLNFNFLEKFNKRTTA
jgi:hypothetical protein